MIVGERLRIRRMFEIVIIFYFYKVEVLGKWQGGIYFVRGLLVSVYKGVERVREKYIISNLRGIYGIGIRIGQE